MSKRICTFLIVVTVAACAACSGGTGNANTRSAQNAAPPSNASTGPAPAVTPSKEITEADVAKLKWLEGTWRGMNGDKPFYERYHFEGSTIIVETFEDGTLAKVKDTSRIELRDGEFASTSGDMRSAASSITDNSVQFVPSRAPGAAESAPVGGFTYRFERQDDGTWNAILDTPSSRGRPAEQKIYKMEPWKGER